MNRFRRWLPRIVGETWIYFLAFQHLLWGTSLLLSPVALHTTGLDSLLHLFPQYAAGTVFIGCALLSLYGMNRPPDYSHFLLMLPQMAILVFSAGGAINIIYQGHFATGEVYSRWFLVDDQYHQVAFLLMYVLSLMKHFNMLARAESK